MSNFLWVGPLYASGKDTQFCNSFPCILSSGGVCLCVRVFFSQLCLILLQPLCTATCWAPLSMEFSRQEYWSGLPFPSPGVFLTRDQIWVSSSAGRFFTMWATREAQSEDRSYYYLYGYEVALLICSKDILFPMNCFVPLL